MKSIRIGHLAPILALIGLSLIVLEAHKTVHLRINGGTKTMTAYAFTVGDFLGWAEISIREEDRLEPPLDHWLREGETVVIERAAQTRIQDEDNSYAILSVERLPSKLLSIAGLRLSPDDRLLYSGRPVSADEPLPRSSSHSLQILRAKSVPIQSGNENKVIRSSAATVGRALWESEIRVFAQDQLDPGYETALSKPTRVNHVQSKELEVHSKGHTVHIRTTKLTVGEALAEAGLPLQGLDYSKPASDARLPTDRTVRIVHVEEQASLEAQPLPFDTRYQPVPDLELDKQSVIQAGTYGISGQRVRVRLEDGEEVSREVEAEFVGQEPKPRIVGYGTKIVPRTTNAPGGTIKYWRALNMYAVSYNPTSAGGTITASGLPLQKGIVAVDPAYIPLRTRLFIPGYGEAVAADTGGKVKGRIIDLGYSDHDYVPWHQWVTVYFLWPPPESVVWVIP